MPDGEVDDHFEAYGVSRRNCTGALILGRGRGSIYRRIALKSGASRDSSFMSTGDVADKSDRKLT